MRRYELAARLLFASATLLVTSRANAEPCNTVAARAGMAASLRLATEERPVNVTFATRATGVKVPAYLLENYPDEMPIVLQYEFDRLIVTDDGFDVSLWFKHKYARLTVPFDAVREFYDNSVRTCGRDDKDSGSSRP